MRQWISAETTRERLLVTLNDMQQAGATIFSIIDGPSGRKDYLLVVAFVDPQPMTEAIAEQSKKAAAVTAPPPAKKKGKR